MNPEKRSTLHRFQERLRIARQGGRKVDISFLLDAAAEAESIEDFVRWLEQVFVWVRVSGGSGTSAQTSLKFLLSRIAQNPAWKTSVASVFQGLPLKTSFVHLFSDTGVYSNYDFVRESLDRLVRSCFPAAGDLSQAENSVARIFSRPTDSGWIADLNPELRGQTAALLFADEKINGEIAAQLVTDISEACTLLCVRLSAICIQQEILERSGRRRVTEIPPLRLRGHIEAYFTKAAAQASAAELAYHLQDIEQEIINTRKYIDDVRSHLELFGVSVRIVFGLEAAESILKRIESLLRFTRWLRADESDFDPWSFFAGLVASSHEEARVWPLIKSNFHLLSRKVVEKTGATGEDYITGNREEYLIMFKAALGGGLITAFTAFFKYLGPKDAAPFVVGLYNSLNYSFWFVLMHQLHFKLATEQPSMTAAALAERLKSGDVKQYSAFIDLVARINRSQFAAVAGNILAVIPIALLIHWVSINWLGFHTLSPETAEHVLETLHPFKTLVVPFAALTGVLLWFSGLVSGWVENAYVYYRIPRAMENHQFINNLLGPENVKRLVDWFSHNLTGWSSSIALGFCLGFVPAMGVFFGLPLQAPHVTLSSGAAAFAIATEGAQAVGAQQIALTALGILLIGLLNFGVSFFLALHIAVRANNIPGKRIRIILKSCARELIRHPRKFFFP